MDLLQSGKPIFAGAPAFLTPLNILIVVGAVLVIALLTWISSINRRRRDEREAEERAAYYDIEQETPSARPITPSAAPIPQPESFDEVLPPSPPVAEPVSAPEPAMVAPEPEPEPVVEAPSESQLVEVAPGHFAAVPVPAAAPVSEPVAEVEAVEAEAPEAEAVQEVEAPAPEPVALEGAPVREPEPAPLEEAPNPAAEPLDAGPTGLEAAIAEPVVAAETIAAPDVETAPEPAAAELAPEPVPAAIAEPEAAPVPAPAPVTTFDDLTRMKGVGPRLAERLNTVGVTSFAQLAAMSPEECAALDSKLGDFQGRLERDRWIEQASLLASGDIAGFEEKFGKL